MVGQQQLDDRPAGVQHLAASCVRIFIPSATGKEQDGTRSARPPPPRRTAGRRRVGGSPSMWHSVGTRMPSPAVRAGKDRLALRWASHRSVLSHFNRVIIVSRPCVSLLAHRAHVRGITYACGCVKSRSHRRQRAPRSAPRSSETHSSTSAKLAAPLRRPAAWRLRDARGRRPLPPAAVDAARRRTLGSLHLRQRLEQLAGDVAVDHLRPRPCRPRSPR